MFEKITLVIPTIRTLDFLSDWAKQLQQVDIIVCEDNPTQTVSIPKVGKSITHYAWNDIDADLQEKSWIIPRRVSGIRNYGFLKAYQAGAEVIITLDDDCYPVAKHPLVELHVRNLTQKVPSRWTNSYPDARHLYTRGIPYLNRSEAPVMLSHGLWTNVLDHDGPTHLQHLEFTADFAEHFLNIIPAGAYFPMCSMNMAFRSEITPIIYFPLMGENTEGKKWGYDRFDDIWAGIFAKKILDHLGYGTLNGSPFVEHRKASNPFSNLKKEAAGIETNEVLWQVVDEVKLTSTTPKECYIELANKVKFPNETYFKQLREAMILWANLF
jgi:reversibly glycosylated polypeptide/UDP-arabinopyranose mutase